MPRQIEGNLDALQVFAAVAEAGGFTAAADKLGMTKAGVSLQVSRLEARLGVSLFSRTTRRVRLTQAGEALHAQCAPALQALRDALAGSAGPASGLAGSLRLTAPVDHAVQSVAPAVAEFAARHPDLQIELHTGDRVVDLVAEGIDVAIRLGELRDSSLRAIKLGSFEQVPVAAPDYLARKGKPQFPEDLAAHDWVVFTRMRTPLTWTFRSGAGETRSVRTKGRIRVDSSAALRSLLLCGAGISVLDQFGVEAAIKSGRLQRLLPDWSLPRGGVYAVLPPGRHVAANARAFIDFYREYMAGSDLKS